MSRRGISLEEISEDYPIILVDTSALIGKINREGYDAVRNSANFFIDYIKNNRNSFYVTLSVFGEYYNERSLLDAIQSNSRILQFNGGEKLWYDVLFKQYSRIRDIFELAETDYDFLVSGVVLSEARKKPVALISNDIGILRSWKFLLIEECLSPIEFGFLIRVGNDTFKKARPPKKLQKIINF